MSSAGSFEQCQEERGLRMLSEKNLLGKTRLARWSRVPLAACILAGLLAGLLLSPTAHAVPACPSPRMVALPGGGSAKVFLRGDELLNWHEDEQGYALVRNAGEGWVYAEYVGEGVFKATKYALGEANPAEAGIARPDYSQLRAFALEKEEERAAAAPPTRAPLTGTMRNLVILVNFTDLRIQSDVPDPVPAFDALFNQPGYHMDGAVGRLGTTIMRSPTTG